MKQKVKVTYIIDRDDWEQSDEALADREKCVDALAEWFENLSLKTQLAIHYAGWQSPRIHADSFDPDRHCPWLKMLRDAEHRIMKKHAEWATQTSTGHNLFLITQTIRVEEVAI